MGGGIGSFLALSIPPKDLKTPISAANADMARTQNRLTDTTIRNAKPVGDTTIRKLSDGGGLQLWIMPTGSKLWRLDYRYGGKRKGLALGSYPLLSLQAAREKAREEREALARGEDPSSRKKLRKLAALAAAENTFGALAVMRLLPVRANADKQQQ